MDSSIISGLIGGAVAIVFGLAVTKMAQSKETNGALYHSKLILYLFIASSAIAVFAFGSFFYDDDIYTKNSELYSVIGLVFGFGLSAIYSYGEYFKVNGTFNSQEIEFNTPWTGRKKETWDNLVSIKFNSALYWYVLDFRSGTRIRLSSYLIGLGQVLKILEDCGYDF